MRQVAVAVSPNVINLSLAPPVARDGNERAVLPDKDLRDAEVG
jgi:hypothetical protein